MSFDVASSSLGDIDQDWKGEEQQDEERAYTSWHVICGRILFGFGAVAIFLFSIAINLGIIYYERAVSGQHHTLINKMAASISVYNIILASSFLPVTFSRELIFTDGLPWSICWLNLFLVRFGVLQALMTLGEVTILRYLYVCVLSSVGSINEELLRIYFLALNVLLSTLGSILIMTTQMTSLLVFSHCVNESLGKKKMLLPLLIFVKCSLLIDR